MNEDIVRELVVYGDEIGWNAYNLVHEYAMGRLPDDQNARVQEIIKRHNAMADIDGLLDAMAHAKDDWNE